MRNIISNDKGFSLTELMISMTILAVGLLAVAQMQIVALQGTSASTGFSTATNLARAAVESTKVPGVFMATGGVVYSTGLQILHDTNTANNTDSGMAPVINTTTDIKALAFDSIEVLTKNPATRTFHQDCFQQHSNDCDDDVIDAGDFVRLVNVRNIPTGAADSSAIMKEVNVIVLWKERELTRSISIRTKVGRKDSDFF